MESIYLTWSSYIKHIFNVAIFNMEKYSMLNIATKYIHACISCAMDKCNTYISHILQTQGRAYIYTYRYAYTYIIYIYGEQGKFN